VHQVKRLLVEMDRAARSTVGLHALFTADRVALHTLVTPWGQKNLERIFAHSSVETGVLPFSE